MTAHAHYDPRKERTTFTFTLPDMSYAKLTRLAAELHMSKAELLRSMIDDMAADLSVEEACLVLGEGGHKDILLTSSGWVKTS